MNNYSLPQYPTQTNPGTQPQPIKNEINAVKIELINPQAYGSAPASVANSPYSYPQNQIYQSEKNLNQQAMASVPFMPQQPLPTDKKTLELSNTPEPPAENFVPKQTSAKKEIPPAIVDQKAPEVAKETAPKVESQKIVAQNIETAKETAPKAEPQKFVAQNIETTPKAEPPKNAVAKEIPPVKEIVPEVNLKPITGALKSDDLDNQFFALQKIAEIGQNPKVPSDLLLTEEVFTGLSTIITRDTSNMPGPTAEQETLRGKKFSGEKLTPEQNELAETISPKEAAEMNKQYAIYTLAVVQKNFRNSVNKEASKQGLEPVRLNEIPEMDTVIENIKSNPSPLIREAGISALTYIAKPEDKEALNVIFSIASNDKDPIVKETAEKAKEKINNLN